MPSYSSRSVDHHYEEDDYEEDNPYREVDGRRRRRQRNSSNYHHHDADDGRGAGEYDDNSSRRLSKGTHRNNNSTKWDLEDEEHYYRGHQQQQRHYYHDHVGQQQQQYSASADASGAPPLRIENLQDTLYRRSAAADDDQRRHHHNPIGGHQLRYQERQEQMRRKRRQQQETAESRMFPSDHRQGYFPTPEPHHHHGDHREYPSGQQYQQHHQQQEQAVEIEGGGGDRRRKKTGRRVPQQQQQQQQYRDVVSHDEYDLPREQQRVARNMTTTAMTSKSNDEMFPSYSPNKRKRVPASPRSPPPPPPSHNSSHYHHDGYSTSYHEQQQQQQLHKKEGTPNRHHGQRQQTPTARSYATVQQQEQQQKRITEEKKLADLQYLRNVIQDKDVSQLEELMVLPEFVALLDVRLLDPVDEGRTPMHFAVLTKDMKIVQACLRDTGATIAAVRDDFGDTPLTLAMSAFPSSVMFLLKNGKGKNIRAIDENGRTVLHHAVTAKAVNKPYDRLEIVKELVERYSVPIGVRDMDGFTAAEWARQNYLGLGMWADDVISYLNNPPKQDLMLQQIQDRSLLVIFLSPGMRIFFFIVMLTCHCLAYAGDSSWRDRGEMVTVVNATAREQFIATGGNITTNTNVSFMVNVNSESHHQNATFIFVFETFNMIGQNWPTNNSVLLAAKFLCILLGALFGALLFYALLHVLVFGILLKLRIFGQGEKCAEKQDRNRGICVTLFYGMFTGIYAGAHIYNVLIDEHFSEHELPYKMKNDIGLAQVETLNGLWICTLIAAWLLTLSSFDVMVQHAKLLHARLPDRGFGDFATTLQDRSGLRTVLFWVLFLLGVFGAIFPFVFIYYHENNAEVAVGTKPYLDFSLVQQVALSSLSLFSVAVVMAQDWTAPSLACPLELSLTAIPVIRTNASWFNWFLGSVIIIFDSRLLHAEISLLISLSCPFSTTLEEFTFAMALVPCGIAVLILLAVVFGSSEHIRRARAKNSVVSVENGGTGEDSQLSVVYNDGDDTMRNNNSNKSTLSNSPGSPNGKRKRVPQSSSPNQKGSGSYASSSSQHHRRDGQQRYTGGTNDVWSCAYNDDVIKMCSLIDHDPSLLNARGGVGLMCDGASHTAHLCDVKNDRCAATPLHYAIVANSRAAMAALVSRGANPRVRSTHGMFSCVELAELINNRQFLDMLST